MSTAYGAAEEMMVDVQGLSAATIEPAPGDNDLIPQPGPKKQWAAYDVGDPDDHKDPDDPHPPDTKAKYDEDGEFMHVMEDDHVTDKSSSAILVESSKAVAAMELDRAMAFYQINLPLDVSFSDLKMGSCEVAIHEHEKAAVFMNYLRHKPNTATLYDLVKADDYDLINWSEFQVDEKGIYTVDRVYHEITWALNQLRRKYYQYEYQY